ncbi:hypothetical protein [Lederbergia lenta]|uniref:hypothetical protein n=1 Tax=Lederbergia lenta TaxID=1467 RepID=UPI00203F0BBB|nr:hypothetical protein [Lederbergia lenta]MCM3110662.1 hypothetical protein [Lederbergia lenta]
MPIEELKHIVATQKTVSTSRLSDLVMRVERMYINQGQKVNRQKNALREANRQLQREKDKNERITMQFQQEG